MFTPFFIQITHGKPLSIVTISTYDSHDVIGFFLITSLAFKYQNSYDRFAHCIPELPKQCSIMFPPTMTSQTPTTVSRTMWLCCICNGLFRPHRLKRHDKDCTGRTFTEVRLCRHCNNHHQVPSHPSDVSYCCFQKRTVSTTSSEDISFHAPPTVETVDLNESSFQESCGDTTPANSSFTNDDKICTFTGLDGVLYKYEPSEDSSGYIPKVTRAVPIPKEFELPRRDELEMDPIELELMIFINKHFLSPSIYDDIMKWACRAYTSN